MTEVIECIVSFAVTLGLSLVLQRWLIGKMYKHLDAREAALNERQEALDKWNQYLDQQTRDWHALLTGLIDGLPKAMEQQPDGGEKR